MRVLVLLEVGADVRVRPDLDPRSGRLRTDWLVPELDPASDRALALAAALKADHGAEVTAVHLGAPAAESWLRAALARGADRAVRVWSEELEGATAPVKALVLAAAAQAAGFELLLAGTAGVLGGDGQVGVLLAARLGVPCVTQAVALTSPGDAAEAGVEVTRGLQRGFRERVAASLPLVVTVAADGAAPQAPPDPSAAARLAAQAATVTVWDIADLGVPREQLRRAGRALRHGPVRPARPRLHAIAAPDSSLSAFERILKLVEGSVKRRAGRVVRESPSATVDELFASLLAEGWLDHLRPDGGGAAPGDPGPGPHAGA